MKAGRGGAPGTGRWRPEEHSDRSDRVNLRPIRAVSVPCPILPQASDVGRHPGPPNAGSGRTAVRCSSRGRPGEGDQPISVCPARPALGHFVPKLCTTMLGLSGSRAISSQPTIGLPCAPILP